MKSQLYAYLGRRMLGTAFVGCRGWWAMHAIRGKTTTCMHSGSLVWPPNSPVKLGKECLILPDTAFISYRVQLGLYTVSILGNTSYTLIRLGKHAFRILCTILGNTSYTLTYSRVTEGKKCEAQNSNFCVNFCRHRVLTTRETTTYHCFYIHSRAWMSLFRVLVSIRCVRGP